MAKFIAQIWAAINLDQDHKWLIPVASYFPKVWLQHIKTAQLDVI